MRENSALRAAARSQLKGGWLSAIIVFIVYSILSGAGSVFFGVGLLIIGGPLTLGYFGYFLRKVRGEQAEIENLFDGFKTAFGSSFLLFLLEGIFVGLWSLLFIIPGIVKALSYSMALFIMHDTPGISALGAINASRKMMYGHKTKLFWLFLSFIGWGLLCIVTLGIGCLWLAPYQTLSIANFYEDLKQNAAPSS
jgi:uncharacterized membrane protein